jgi:hypothetical protein
VETFITPSSPLACKCCQVFSHMQRNADLCFGVLLLVWLTFPCRTAMVQLKWRICRVN